jgi:hypothetical protein
VPVVSCGDGVECVAGFGGGDVSVVCGGQFCGGVGGEPLYVVCGEYVCECDGVDGVCELQCG